jgi:hypothetical protein
MSVIWTIWTMFGQSCFNNQVHLCCLTFVLFFATNQIPRLQHCYATPPHVFSSIPPRISRYFRYSCLYTLAYNTLAYKPEGVKTRGVLAYNPEGVKTRGVVDATSCRSVLRLDHLQHLQPPPIATFNQSPLASGL